MKIPNQRGFTLLELILYIGILAIVMVVIVNIFVALSKGNGNVEARTDVDSNLRYALEKINQDVRAASSVTTPASAGATSSTLVMTVSGSTITYDVSSGQLRRQVNAGTPVTITPTTVTVAAPTFTRLHNTNTVLSVTVVTIVSDLTISRANTSPDKQYSQRKKTTAALR
jgi:prepilin-type N-terminal cleavage/methylation domain-containing protein